METITTLAALDRKLAELDAAAAISDAELRRAFDTFKMEPAIAWISDPDSADYVAAQFALYEKISGRHYTTDNEKTPFDPVTMAAKPFPYLNNNWEVTGDQLIAIGWIFKSLRLPSGASVLEFGPGWGNTTIAMARNGYRVTAIEIEPNFVELIREQARRVPVDLEVIRGDFMDAATLGRTFDCVLFFECFHHCGRHNDLLDLMDKLVAPGGQIAFAAEPITDEFAAPWGLRLDGQSLWAIRKHGWLELGFTESYFIRSLMRRGWLVAKHVLPWCPLAVVYTARRAEGGRYPLSTFRTAPDEDRTWGAPETDLSLQWRYAGAASRLTIKAGAGVSVIEADMANTAPFPLSVTLRHGQNEARVTVPPHSEVTGRVTADHSAHVLEIASDTWNPADALGSVDNRVIGVGVRAITASPG
jgi:2-polyprenyl-3-methyl-5-hydroxy-6-metoxy-1,4-benzoquinol methylase